MPWWWWSMLSRSIWEDLRKLLSKTICPRKPMCPLSCTTNVNHIRFDASREMDKCYRKIARWNHRSQWIMILMKTPWYKRCQTSELRKPCKNAQVKSPSCRQNKVSMKNIDLTTNTQMIGSNRLSNHHRRTPDAKEAQEFPQKSFSIIKISRAKDPFTMRSSPL